MYQKSRGIRIAGGIIILFNIIIFFLPMAVYKPNNYPAERYSQLNYMIEVFNEKPPYETVYTSGRLVWMMVLILLPFLLSLISGIWGLVGSSRQKVSSILILVTLCLYIGLFVSIGGLFPNEDYSRSIAGILNLVVSSIAAVLAVIALVWKEQIEEAVISSEIPMIREIKQEQVVAKYNIITGNTPDENKNRLNDIESEMDAQEAGVTEQLADEDADENSNNDVKPQQMIPPYVGDVPRGVMVGLTGIYAGAEIPFNNGEVIHLGRLANNDLVFEGQNKVSRNHCYIKWDGVGQIFLIKDSSSNGTFVNGSEDCLPQNIEIEVPLGSVIAIGDEHNTFRLE